MEIRNENSLETMKQAQDYEFDLIFCDPPYALGSEVIIRKDGRPDYKKAVDFMNKWDMPSGDFWAEFFAESFRALKHGAYMLMFGLDRQLLMFKYYAALAGFQEHQSLYWYFISNFPKASDLSKNIDKFFDEEREVTGVSEHSAKRIAKSTFGKENEGERNITSASHPLAKKYDGYKYSIAPLKQTNETIMVFHKPYLTGSCLHDVLAYENGNTDVAVGALDIDGNKVGFISENDYKESTTKNQHADFGTKPMTNNHSYGDFSMIEQKNYQPDGRYPAQTFVDTGAAEVLDGQSGDLTSGGMAGKQYNIKENLQSNTFPTKNGLTGVCVSDTGGASKALHTCDYEAGEYDLYQYCPKVSSAEREAGMEGTGLTNDHPTLKPISLIKQVTKLFKTPNPQKVCVPFSGAGSEVIGLILAGFDKELITASEMKPDFYEKSILRIDYWTLRHKYKLPVKVKRVVSVENQESFFTTTNNKKVI